LLVSNPECCWIFGQYLQRFPLSQAAASTLLDTLQRDPTYDAAAANYIDALDVCEPTTNLTAYRRVVETAKRRSEENSILLTLAISGFRARRRRPAAALKMIASENNPLARSILIQRIFKEPDAPHKLNDAYALIEKETQSADDDLARYCGWLLITTRPWSGPNSWRPKRATHVAVKLLAFGLGLKAHPPTKPGAIERFFSERKVRLVFQWRRALAPKDLRQAERLSIQVQSYLGGSPDAQVLALDTLNDHLIQSFSRRHTTLSAAFTRAAGARSHPDLGNWLRNPALIKALPNSAAWFLDVHDARVNSQLAHARRTSGKYKGKTTNPISFRKIAQILRASAPAWSELLMEWRKVL
jgi:hypothetical protein